MKRIVTLLLFAICSHINLLYGQFTGTPITVDDGTHTGFTGENNSTAIINGNPAVVYLDRGIGKIKFIRANDASGTSWGNPIIVNLGAIPITLSIYTPMTLKEVNGRPAISFYDDYSHSFKYTRADNANGTSWSSLPITVVAPHSFVFGFNFVVGWNHSMEIVNGHPAFSYSSRVESNLYSETNLNYIRSADANGDVWIAADTVLVEHSVNIADIKNQLKVINGNPAVCYEFRTVVNPTYTLSLKYARANDVNGTTWASSSVVNSVDIPYSADQNSYSSMTEVGGNPAISYFDQINKDLKFIRATNTTGTAWATPQTLDATGVVGTSTTMLTLTNGYAAIAYHDTDNNGTLKFIKSLDATGSSWSAPETIDASYSTGIQNSLILVNNVPAVSYFNYDDHDLIFIRANDAAATSWGTNIAIDKGTSGSVGNTSSLKIVQGNPAIAYEDGSDGALMYVRSSDLNGTTWNIPQRVYSVNSAGQEPLMQIVNGNPSIVFSITGLKLLYVRANDAGGASWGTPIDLDIPILSNSAESSFEIINGKPAISFRNTYTSMLSYIRANDVNGTSWGTKVDVAENGGSSFRTRTSLTTVNGNPAIAYTERLCGCIKYVRANDSDGTSWGTAISIASGSYYDPILKVINGKPAIVYENFNNLIYVRANDADGTSWGTPVVLTNNNGATKSFDVINNKPAVSFRSSNLNLSYIEARDVDGTAWRPVETVDGVGSNGESSSLTVINGLAAISYYDRTNRTLKYVRGSIPPISNASSNALVFNGTSTYALSAEGESGNLTKGGLNLNVGSFTMETWVKFTNVSIGKTSWIAEIGSTINGANVWWGFDNANLTGLGNNKMILGFSGANNGSGGNDFIYDFSPAENIWYHLAYSYNSVTKKVNFFVDGAAIGEKTNGGSATPNLISRPQLRLGNKAVGSVSYRYLDGVLDEFRLWNSAKSASEIQAQFQTELAGTEIGLVTYYKFEETASQLAHLNDCSPNRLDANVSNGSIIASTVSSLTDVACGADPPVLGVREFVGFADGANRNSWNDADNWSPKGIPISYQVDDVLIRHGVVAIDEYRNQTISIRHLTLDGAGAGLTTGTAPSINIAGNFVWTSGQIGVYLSTSGFYGSPTILDTRFAKTLYNGKWSNRGIATWSEANINMNNSEIENYGTIDMNCLTTGSSYGINTSGNNIRNIGNFGTIRCRGASNVTHNLFGSSFYNSGTIQLESTSLSIRNLTNLGQINASLSSSTINLINTTFNNGTSLTGLGTLRIVDAAVNANINMLASTNPVLRFVGNPAFNSGISGTGSITTNGQVDFESGRLGIPLTINSLGSLNMSNNSSNFDKVFTSTLTNSGTINWTGGNIKFQNATFNNNALFNINVPNTVSLSQVSGTSNQLISNGTIKNQFNSVINIPIQYSIPGVSVFSGIGTMTFPSAVNILGKVSPGNSPGTLTLNPSVTSTPYSNYIMEIVGAAADRLESVGDIALSGTLQISMNNPNIGDYTIFKSTGGNVTGLTKFPDGSFNIPVLFSLNGSSYSSALPINTTIEINANTIVVKILGLVVLPVELIQFQAQNTEGPNKLTWQTASEKNTSHFDIEKSKDGLVFEKIGEVKAAGNSQTPQYYSYLDRNPYDLSYYRLKIHDLDGKTDFSKTVSVRRDGKLNVKIYPNPAQQVMTVDMGEMENTTLTVIDVLGKTVYQKAAVSGQNTMDVSTFSKGVYIIEIKAKGITHREKIIKN
jgi:Concanavalin A-like lectin/glucanases superfamily/Secretion system C-terminal sorting domain